MSENRLNVEREIELMANRKDFDFWEFLKKAYESNVKLDIGHFIILNILIGVGELYRRLSEEVGKNQAQKILEKKGIFTKKLRVCFRRIFEKVYWKK